MLVAFRRRKRRFFNNDVACSAFCRPLLPESARERQKLSEMFTNHEIKKMVRKLQAFRILQKLTN
jgi:hypothetical protein